MPDKSTRDRVIELHRKEPELTQIQIAERLEIDGSTVSRYLKQASENGKPKAKTETEKKKVKAKSSRKSKTKRGGADRGVADKVLAEFKKGNTSPTKVAEIVGCSVSYVVNLKKKQGLAGKKAKPAKKVSKAKKTAKKKAAPKKRKKAKKKAGSRRSQVDARMKRQKTGMYPIVKNEMVRDVRLVLIKSTEKWDNGDLIVTHRYRPANG